MNFVIEVQIKKVSKFIIKTTQKEAVMYDNTTNKAILELIEFI